LEAGADGKHRARRAGSRSSSPGASAFADLEQQDAPATAAVCAFADELNELLEGKEPDPDSVRRAARLALAQQAWEQRLGTMLGTRDVMELLGVSRQQVSTLAKVTAAMRISP